MVILLQVKKYFMVSLQVEGLHHSISNPYACKENAD